MFITLDSSPQECLEYKPNFYHTMCFCIFSNPEHALQWMHRLVPKDKNGLFHKWSSKTARSKRKDKIRKAFADNIIRNLQEMDFKVLCISSTESDISHIAQYFFSNNLKNISQEIQENGKNYLIFKITETKSIKMPALRAARLIWTVECCRMLQSEFNLKGNILSDWLSSDTYETIYPAEGVSLINFLLTKLGVDLQLSIPKRASDDTFELISDWFAGWCRSQMEHSEFLKEQFEYLESHSEEKFKSIKFLPRNPILYGNHCTLMEFNTTLNTLRIVF